MTTQSEIDSRNVNFETFKAHYDFLAAKSKAEKRRVLNHLCIRVDDIDAAEQLLSRSFGIANFIRLEGATFKGEKHLSVAWVNEEMYLELMQTVQPQKIGYDTGCSHPIGHLSEVGFFVPNMEDELKHLEPLGWKVLERIGEDGMRMYKIDTEQASGFPVELIDVSE